MVQSLFMSFIAGSSIPQDCSPSSSMSWLFSGNKKGPNQLNPRPFADVLSALTRNTSRCSSVAAAAALLPATSTSPDSSLATTPYSTVSAANPTISPPAPNAALQKSLTSRLAANHKSLSATAAAGCGAFFFDEMAAANYAPINSNAKVLPN